MEPKLTYADVESILKIIDGAEHLDEIDLVYGGFHLHVVRSGAGNTRTIGARSTAASASSAAAKPAQTAATAPPAQTREIAVPEGAIAIRAPMLGTFYRAPAPGEKPFVEEGQRVLADDTVGLIEVMKLFNSIRAGVNGIVVRIVAENGGLVEYNQLLVVIAQDREA